MKRIVTRQLIILSLITSVSNFSFVHGQAASLPVPPTAAELAASAAANYCKTSSVCGTAPKDFTLLLGFVREMTNSIKTQGTEGSYLGIYINPNRFKGNVFAPPAQTVLSRLERNVLQKIAFGLASTAIFMTPANLAGLKDFGGGIILLGKNQAFLRDNKIVEELDSLVTDKRYELGIGGGRYAKANPQNVAVMQNIIDAYIEKGLLLKGSKITDGVLYSNVTSLLVQLVSVAKNFLYSDVPQLADINFAGTANGIQVSFNPVAINAIIYDYACAKGPNYICSSELKKFNSGISKIRSNAKTSASEGASSAKKTFLDAVKRFGQIFSKTQEESFKTREAELLTSMYGTQKVSRGVLINVSGLKEIGAAAGEAGAAAVQAGKAVGAAGTVVGKSLGAIGKGISAYGSSPKNVQDIAQSIPKNITSSPVNADVFTQIIDSYTDDVFASQTTDLKLAAFAEVKDVTPAFKVLGDQIAAIKTNILGGKDKDGSLIKSLGEACELQCGGIGKCRQ